jgi:pyruvate carboxylase subunit B
METLQIDDFEYKTTLTKKFKNRKKYEAKNPKLITAFIPGTIKDIFVAEGTKVSEGDKLLTLEAMKMVNELISHEDGVVKKVWVIVGDKVTKDQLLVELE